MTIKNLACLGLLVMTGVRLSAQGSIDTIPAWNGTQFISSFGIPNTATYGQTITLAASSGRLLSFAFQIGNCSAPVAIRGSIYAWDGTRATGASLYESLVTTVPIGSQYQLVTFTTNSLTLPAGAYVLFASTSQDPGANSACRWGSVTNTNYGGGQFVYINNGTSTAQWTSNAWSTIASDLAFSASFTEAPRGPSISSVPTLSEWAMILLACGLTFVASRSLRGKSQPGGPIGS